VLRVDRKRRVGQPQQSREIVFEEIIFSFSFFSHRANAFQLVGIARRTICRSAEAGGKICALWYGLVATGVPILQRSALVVLRVDRKRRVGQPQQSRGILFRKIIFSFSILTQRLYVLIDRIVRRTTLARLILCCMDQPQPGCQFCNASFLSCFASIAMNDSARNNILGDFFSSIFFSFLLHLSSFIIIFFNLS
jgi:hypothetical protein